MYTEKKFLIGPLEGISEKNILEHQKLYSGYVKHANLILTKIKEYSQNPDNAYAISEINRRFSFEYNGMRNHEYFFELLEGQKQDKVLKEDSNLRKYIEKSFSNFDTWLQDFKNIAMTRGIGWAILYYDKNSDNLVNCWVDEQHLGQLNGGNFILGIDMWEHSYLLDYLPSEKKKYIDVFFENINWTVAENFLNKAIEK